MTSEPEVKIQARPLTSEQEGWLESAWSFLDESRLAQLLTDAVNISSPTGQEGTAAQFFVEEMQRAGLTANYQYMDDSRGNAIGCAPGRGGGRDLLFYGHLDHYFSETEDDILVTGGLSHPILYPQAWRDGQFIGGAGAANPKAGCVVALHAIESVLRAGADLKGSVVLGFVAGGIHKVQQTKSARRYVGRRYLGQGAGCEFMLKNGVRADFAINTKPGYSVTSEDPGVLWMKVTVKGVVGYVQRAGKSTIVDAAHLILELNEWFEQYADSHSVGQVTTPAHVGAIEGGWPFKPDFSPAACNLYLDIRTNPRDDLQQIKRELDDFLLGVQQRNPALQLEWEAFSSVPGSRTDLDNWIVQSAMRAWERVENRPHVSRTLSGMTDGALLRSWGIPTARLGNESSRVRDPSAGFLASDGADLENLVRLARCYVYTIIDTCARSYEEL